MKSLNLLKCISCKQAASSLAVLGFALSTLAQAAPDAGSILQEIERDRKPAAPSTSAPPLIKPEAKPKSQNEATVVVKKFTVSGNTLIAESVLEAVIDSYRNRPLTMDELQQAADALVQFYLDRGYLVRTILPKQDVTEGTVRIQVIESSFSGSEIEGNIEGKRISESRLKKTVDAQIKPGDPLSLKKLERGLMLADDIPGVNVTGRLVAGANDLTTGVVLNVSDEPLIYGEAAVDNFGSYSTGPLRYTLNGTMSGVLKMGDQVSLYALNTEGIDFGRLGFSLPAGYDGWRVGVNASYMQYKIVEGPAGKGNSTVFGLDSNYPIYRSRPDNLYFVANLDQKFFDNTDAAGATTTKYQSVVFSTGFNGSTTDKILKGGLTSGNLMLSMGNINLDGSPNQTDDRNTINAQGHFEKLKFAITHTQNIIQDLVGFVSWSGQLASKNMDSSEKFYLGGPIGIRAYPNNEGGGSEGQLVTFELRQNLPLDLVLTAFYDEGHVTVNKNNNFTGAPSKNNLAYKGAGLQLGWYGPKNINIKAVWAHRIGENPFPVEATGHDQDGTKKMDRFWLSASIPF
jgi:hemolysin activation/secretion protein